MKILLLYIVINLTCKNFIYLFLFPKYGYILILRGFMKLLPTQNSEQIESALDFQERHVPDPAPSSDLGILLGNKYNFFCEIALEQWISTPKTMGYRCCAVCQAHLLFYKTRFISVCRENSNYQVSRIICVVQKYLKLNIKSSKRLFYVHLYF